MVKSTFQILHSTVFSNKRLKLKTAKSMFCVKVKHKLFQKEWFGADMKILVFFDWTRYTISLGFQYLYFTYNTSVSKCTLLKLKLNLIFNAKQK